MTDIPANPNTHPKRYSAFWFRFFEILPGACVWTALLAPFLLSFSYPLAITIFILVFDVYWVVQTFNYTFILSMGYRRLKYNLGIDWAEKVQSLSSQKGDLQWKDLYQVVLLTTYKEDDVILNASIQSIIDSPYPKEQFIFVLATEERAGTEAVERAARLKERFASHFLRFIVTVHPDDIVGEVKAKGANASWAAKQLVKEVTKLGIPFEHVVVSTADADTRFSPPYFYRLAYTYLTHPDRIHSSYQPIPIYFNNIWEAPMISRVMAFGTTFWQLIESVRDYRLITFATHAMSLQTLVDINFWSTSIVNEDSRQFFRAFFHYKGHFHATPLYVPIYMDAVHVNSLRGTLHNLYFQQQRWAYGVEHFPYIVLESFRQRSIPIIDRFMLIWRAFQGTFSWATSSFFITLIGWIPIALNARYRDAVAVSNFILVTKTLLSFTWVGLILSSFLTMRILLLVPQKRRWYEFVTMSLQWALVPFIGIFFSSLPCLDSITRLMLGKYIGFRVTEKAAVEV